MFAADRKIDVSSRHYDKVVVVSTVSSLISRYTTGAVSCRRRYIPAYTSLYPLTHYSVPYQACAAREPRPPSEHLPLCLLTPTPPRLAHFLQLR